MTLASWLHGTTLGLLAPWLHRTTLALLVPFLGPLAKSKMIPYHTITSSETQSQGDNHNILTTIRSS
jgi:hypothetical protein